MNEAALADENFRKNSACGQIFGKMVLVARSTILAHG
jgi:hypothetical protein